MQNCYVIAEIGVNHNGSLDLAFQLIEAAAAAKADAVKFQTFQAEDLVTKTAAKADYQQANTMTDDTQFEMLKSLELSEEEFGKLKQFCKKKSIDFLSTPFSEKAVDILSRIGVDKFKVSSGDLTHLGLLKHIALQGRPIILSTGMGTLGEIEEALDAIKTSADVEVSLLHCVSNYPAAPEDCNLAAMDTMSRAFGVPIGWSDHSIGTAISWAAVAKGAKIIEKHITLDCALPGPDHKASMEPSQFKEFVEGIRTIETACGTGLKVPTEAEMSTALMARRSLTSVRALTKGDRLRLKDVKVVRPGTGLKPKMLPVIVGLTLRRDVPADTPLKLGDFHGS